MMNSCDLGISDDGGSQPRWRKDGKELYFLGRDLKMMEAAIRFPGSSLESDKPVPLFPVRIPSEIDGRHGN